MDSFASNKRFAQDIGVKFPLLSDWNRKTTKEYGLYNEQSGYGSRATFVIDKDGIIRDAAPGGIGPDAMNKALEKIMPGVHVTS